MGLKTVQKLNEGPWDFMRGAGAAAGQKIAQSGVSRAVGDVVNAGKQASAAGNFQKALSRFAELLSELEKLRPSGERTQQQEPTAEPPQVPPKQNQQSIPANTPGVAQAFRSERKPRGVAGKYSMEYTFNSFLQDTHGEQINEGVWDFVKGAGAAVAGKMRDKINAYADKPSVLKDIYTAGKAASQAGDAQAQAAKYDKIKQKAIAVRGQLRQMMSQLGPQGPAILAKGLAQFPPELQHKMKTHIMGKPPQPQQQP